MKTGLYVHVPFCKTRCHFCAFYLRIHREDLVQAYLQAFEAEVHLHGRNGRERIPRLDTVYFGGGTPTTLRPEQLDGMLAHIRRTFTVARQAEITIEAHPDTIAPAPVERLRQAGFTRISFGVQSGDQGELIRLGRRPPKDPVRKAIESSRQAGFSTINIDLIFGAPGQTIDGWIKTVDEALEWQPDHVSCYALSVEQHSHLDIDVRRGHFPSPDPALQNDLEEAAAARLSQAGYERYEISNYARPGHACRHNLLYWQGGQYIGFGPSAQSYFRGIRFGNVEDLDAYSRSLRFGTLPITQAERLDPPRRRREAIVFGLRLVNGVPCNQFWSGAVDTEWREAVQGLLEQGLLEEEDGRVRLTRTGRRFADSVAVVLL